MVLSTAHPCYDPRTGEFVSVNYSRSVANLLLSSTPLLQGLGRLPDAVCNDLAEAFEQQPVSAPSQRLTEVLETIRLYLPSAPESTLRRFVGMLKGGGNFVHLLRWDGKGDLERFELVLPGGHPVRIEQSIHQIGLTRNYVVLADTASRSASRASSTTPRPSGPPWAGSSARSPRARRCRRRSFTSWRATSSSPAAAPSRSGAWCSRSSRCTSSWTTTTRTTSSPSTRGTTPPRTPPSGSAPMTACPTAHPPRGGSGACCRSGRSTRAAWGAT